MKSAAENVADAAIIVADLVAACHAGEDELASTIFTDLSPAEQGRVVSTLIVQLEALMRVDAHELGMTFHGYLAEFTGNARARAAHPSNREPKR